MQQKILIVEDSPVVTKIMTRIAESLNLHVTVASSFADVIRITEREKDFLVSTADYSLPDAPNGEAIYHLLENQIPTIVITGQLDKTTRLNMLKLPIIDYITKESTQAYVFIHRTINQLMSNIDTEILVVDDSLVSCTSIASILKQRLLKVYTAENGEEAIKKLKSHPNIRLVVTDYEMPEMGGLELISQIRKQYTRDQLAIIGLSASSDDFISARFLKNGADDFLSKPFSQEELSCRVMQHIERLDYIDQIQFSANYDYLTELPNRRYFYNELPAYLEGCDFSAVATLDVDHFKQVNDTYGHDGGDVALKSIARIIKRLFPNTHVARFGGEEFAMVFKHATFDEIIEALEKFRETVSQFPIKFQTSEFKITVSIGLATLCNRSIDEVIGEADEALYAAKQRGRNQLVVSGQ